ncbi:prolyl oligopeptidase family serine peptidase [Tunturiibacter psychrotolerans]|uniref:alpha/beta hydrolase family protein n=1 Tax=Tunturiibacter psychrotolerans TaxID=3069686 RepID=UPI003D1CC5BA
MKKLSILVSMFLVPGMLLAQTQRLTLDDLLSAGSGRRSTGQLSPDGRFFAREEQGQIALVPVNGRQAKIITSSPKPTSELQWSHDGKHIAYVSEGDVWIVANDGSQPQRLTHDPAGPGDPRGATDHHPLWNPNGHWILFESGRKGFNELYVVSEDGSQEKLLAATEIYTGSDVIANTATDRGDAVSSDRFDPEPLWSPDGTRVSYTERSREFFSGKLKVLTFDQKTGSTIGTASDLYTAKNDPGGAWAINSAAWSPDSTTLTVVLQSTGWDKLWQIPATGGTPKQLTKGTGEDENPSYSPDGRWIAFNSNRDLPEERHLWVVPAAGGSPHRLTSLAGIETNPQWSPDSAFIYFSRATSLRAATTYVANTDGKGNSHLLEPSQSSKYEGLGITPEIARFKSKDGLALAGILYKPAGYKPGKRYPAIIWAHGGPEGQVVLSLNPWSLFLAQQGYVVLEPNFRGSTGYGERFRNANVEDSGGGEIDDIAASVKYLVDTGLADSNRVAIGGGSHGGTVVANAVAKLPDTFAAGIEMFGVVDRALFLQYTNRNSKIRWETKMGGTPEEKPAVYRKANVLPDVESIKTPLLILHGEKDPQVPPQESAEFAEALKKAGKTYLYFTYPNEGHGFQQRDHRKDSYEKQLAFLDKYLKDPAAGR